MQVNTDIYGAETTWTRDLGFNYAATPDEYCFKKGQYNTLKDYVNAGVLNIGTEIDYSICYAGMAADLPLSKLKTWVVLQTGQSVSDYDIFMYQRNTPTGWFFGHGENFASTFSIIEGSPIILKNKTEAAYRIAKYYWIPDGTITQSTEQASQNITPIVEFNPHACYFGIHVEVYNRQTGAFSTYYLDDMYDHNFTSYDVITRAWGELWTRRGDNDTNYGGAASWCGVCPDKIIDFGQGSMKYLSYAYNLNNNFPLFGWLDGRPSSTRFSGDTLYTAYKRPFYSVSYDGEAANSQYFCDTLNDTVYNTRDTNTYNYIVEAYAPITPSNLEKLRRCAAAYGLFFTEKDPATFYNKADRWISEDMFLGVLDSDGVGWGEYTRGTQNAENPLFDLTSSQQSPYEPHAIDPNVYNNVTEFNTLESNANLLKLYVLDKTNVEILADDLWTICDTLSADDYDNFDGKIKDEFLTTNPIDSIISLIRYPFDIPHFLSNTKTPVQLGKSIGTAEGYRTYNITFGVDFEGVDIYPRFGNSFLDYSPYTKYELYVPFCGTIEINPGDILGHRLNLRLRVDLSTGSVIAYIMADQLVIGTAKGSCGAEQVLNGTQSATVNANIINGLITYDGLSEQKMNQFGRAVYPTGIIKDVLDPFGQKAAFNELEMKQEQAEFNLTHIQTPVHKMGSPSPLLAWLQEFNARLMIFYPEGDVITAGRPPSLIPSALAAFGHLKGFATATPGTVSSFQGSDKQNFLRGSILADNIPCTANERSRIRSLFSDGVYLPIKST